MVLFSLRLPLSLTVYPVSKTLIHRIAAFQSTQSVSRTSFIDAFRHRLSELPLRLRSPPVSKKWHPYVALALSGGCDSSMLAFNTGYLHTAGVPILPLTHFSDSAIRRVAFITVDHSIRSESTDESLRVHENLRAHLRSDIQLVCCNDWQLQKPSPALIQKLSSSFKTDGAVHAIVRLTWSDPQLSEKNQENARILVRSLSIIALTSLQFPLLSPHLYLSQPQRYRAIQSICDLLNISIAMTGHHKDDNVRVCSAFLDASTPFFALLSLFLSPSLFSLFSLRSLNFPGGNFLFEALNRKWNHRTPLY